MVIRALSPADVPAYVALRREALADSPWAFAASAENDVGLDEARMVASLGESRSAVVGAFDQSGRLVASCGVSGHRHRKMAHRAHLWGVYVTPAARGRGVGKAVVRGALDVARTWPGVNSAGLSASARAEAALALYRSLGFVAWGVEPGCLCVDGAFIDEVHLLLRFTPQTAEPARGANARIRRIDAVDEPLVLALADVLLSCVEGGASVGFMLPLTRDRAVSFWRRVADGVGRGERALLIAEDELGVCGTVQLVLDMPDNQPHRADLVKMLVHRRARRRGIGEALMRAAEDTARERARTLLVLDAVTGGDAARLYERLGWVRVGPIPNYALMPDGAPCGTTYFYRDLSGAPGASRDGSAA